MNKIYPTIVSAYSNDEYYIKSAKRFEQFVSKLKNKYSITQFESTKNWHNNTRKKPEIILKNLLQIKDAVIWIDADAEVYKDICVNIKDNIDFMGINQRWGPRRTWCVGTMLFNYTENSIQFLKDWVDKCSNGSGTDEANLEYIWINKWKDILKTDVLPDNLFVLEKLHFKDHNTVILHKSSGNARKGNLS
jgi:hypothetical protein